MPNHVDDLRGASRLVIEAIRGVTEVVEAMHLTIASGPRVLGQPLAGPARSAIRPVYAVIQAATRIVGGGIERALAPLGALLARRGDTGVPRGEREAIVAALNGVLGDMLQQRGNPLVIEMRLRHGGRPLALDSDAVAAGLPHATRKLVVLVHGLCMSDRQWTRNGHDHGAALARELGYTPVYVHYNTGLHISTNGQQLATQLEQLVAAWPGPLDEIVLLGHSMGGLVARSACHAGDTAGHAWRARLRALVCLGSPHHGAPLERGGAWVDLLLGASPYSAPLARLGKIRSAGITDLRFGDILDAHWRGVDRFAHRTDRRRPCPLPVGVACYAIAATRSADPADLRSSDGLVPVSSALGIHATPELTLAFPDAHRWIALQTDHISLLDAADVYAQLRSWLSTS